MKILIVPMAALAETAGPCSRAAAIANALSDAGADIATCAAIDNNFKPLPGIPNYELAVPMPLGLPSFIARRTFPAAQKLGVILLFN